MTPELPAGYHFGTRGLTRETDGLTVANFLLAPTRAYCRDGDTLPSFCDIVVLREGKCIPLQNRVALSNLTPAWWKAPPPGCCYTPGTRAPHRQLQVIFQTLLGRLEPVKIFQPAALGWEMLLTGEPVYITGSGAIGPNGYLPEELVWIPDGLQQYRLETQPSASGPEAAQYFWNLYRAIPGITDTLLANALAAILFPCFQEAGIESRFPIILEGPSEAKKTTIAILCGCLYNRRSNPRSGIATLTSTSRALERRGVELRHAVVVFDDLFPDGGNALDQKALRLIRDIANQTPRQACAGKELDGAQLECGAVITAEAFPNCGRSTRTRCLRLLLQKPIPNGLLLPLQEQPELLGNVFNKFIMEIARNFEGITRQIAEDFREYRRMRAGDISVGSERLYEIGFVLYTALRVYLLLEAGPNLSTDEELGGFQKRLNLWLNWQLSPQAAPGQGWLITAIAEIMRLYPQEFSFRSGYLCITPRRLCRLLQDRYGDQTINVPDIIGRLRAEHLLSMDKSGVATKKIKGRGRCLCIDAQRLLR